MASGTLLPVPMASAAAVLDRRPRHLIDLRSPAEFTADHLPGAVNVPLFDDLERALIGTLYARKSPESAFEEARVRTRAKIAVFAAEIAERCGWELPVLDLEQRVEHLTAFGIARLERELASDPAEPTPDSVVLYCWRGGLRSRSVVTLLRGLGREEVLGIEGGYRAYRQQVRGRIEAWCAPRSFVLRGLTGVGKTLVLRELARLRPEWVLDLEGMAGHRSSILGMVGLEPASQKLFESRLAERIGRDFGGTCVIEGESRKVGDLILPEPVWRALDGGVALELTAQPARRVRVLLEDYLVSPESRAELACQLPFIETRLGSRWNGELVAMLASGREAELVELLLQRYYDPLYGHSERGRRYAASFDSTHPRVAATEIVRWIERQLASARTLAPAAGARSSAVPLQQAPTDL
ncbi:MAG: tRNA 2-selenouridine(34) synthase MnmH [Planctomycetes bacterium]|nr:tRNA 2-selenouridine(34) synthase MnmH [Planctomycetota bacterium]